MRKLSALLLFAFLATLVLAIPAPAATLQEGWYANVAGLWVYQYDQWGYPFIRSAGSFYNTPPGQYGPFQVTDGTYHSSGERYVSVPAQVSAGPSDTLAIPVSFGMTLGEQIAYMQISWGTNYDPSQMRLQLWRQRYDGSDQLVWSELGSGVQGGAEYIHYGNIFEGDYYFEVEVVPEPQAIGYMLLAFFPAMLGLKRRR